jgi:cell division protein FtsW
MAKKLKIDWTMFAAATGLALFGVVMVYSASAVLALQETKGTNQYLYVTKQFAFVALGLGTMFLATRFDYRWLQQNWVVYGLLLITALLLVSVFFFPPINGARRWVRFAGISLQPSELAKIALPLFLAFFFNKKDEEEIGSLKETFLPALAVFGVLAALIYLEPDLGTVIVLSAIFAAVYFSAGARILHIGFALAGFLVLVAGALVFTPFRMRRWVAFMDPLADAKGAGYQVVQSLYAIGSGGIFGEGFANGQQKLFYLPYPHSDFIFAVVGEELGLIGTLAVLLVFGLLLWRGARASMMAPDRFGMLLGIGLITGIIVQAFFNISVVIAMMPTKGIPLPFISYGGSSVVVTLFAVGLLLNISQYAGFIELKRTETENSKVKRRKQK